jgi:hypothetical protein
MRSLYNCEERKAIRREHKLGFPYPVVKRTHKDKHNIIGDIPLNELTSIDYESMISRAPLELKELLVRTSISTYYEIRDDIFIKNNAPASDVPIMPGYSRYCFIFGDYILEFSNCGNFDDARSKSIMYSLKHGEAINRVYRLSKGKWKRVRGIA